LSTIDGGSKLRNSPVGNPRSASRDANSSKIVAGARGIPMPFTGENNQERMNSLLKSPIKNNLQMVPVRNGKTGSAKMYVGSNTSVKGVAMMADHTNTMIVNPTTFV